MKIDRLIGIITILLQNDKVTAPQLAKRFEVSRRTINRDIEDICKAGIPLATTQGAQGGITIMDGYKIDKTLFSEEDLRAIFTGLTSLDSITHGQKYQTIIEKFTSQKQSFCFQNNILIDLSSYYKATLAPQIELLQAAINQNLQVSFLYHNKHGENMITADPYLIVFQWSSWYLLAFDPQSEEFKLYKLGRLTDLSMTEATFLLQEIPPEKLNFKGYFTDEIQAVILFDKSEKYRLLEEYGANSFSETPQGVLRFEFPFTNLDYLITWVLGFGDKAELIEPIEVRERIKNQLDSTMKKYSQ